MQMRLNIWREQRDEDQKKFRAPRASRSPGRAVRAGRLEAKLPGGFSLANFPGSCLGFRPDYPAPDRGSDLPFAEGGQTRQKSRLFEELQLLTCH